MGLSASSKTIRSECLAEGRFREAGSPRARRAPGERHYNFARDRLPQQLLRDALLFRVADIICIYEDIGIKEVRTGHRDLPVSRFAFLSGTELARNCARAPRAPAAYARRIGSGARDLRENRGLMPSAWCLVPRQSFAPP